VGKLDVDNNQQSAIKYGVRSIPTLLLFKDGKVVDTIIGAVPKPMIVNKIEPLLKTA
ncbi:MAG: thioredoxin family protein, partial [Ignavibacterium sp.]